MPVEVEITLPYKPRPLQRELHRIIRKHRWTVAVCHRRFGKSVGFVNHLIRAAIELPRDRPRFGYIAPTYRMGKAIAWDYFQHYAGPIPGIAFNQSELRADFPGGGQCRIYGADNPDSLRGIYLDGAIFDEYGLMPPNVFSEVIRPALADREGWAVFGGTPAGKNQFYDVATRARGGDEGWGYAEYRASQTGILSEEELALARSVMTADEYAQEFECSFEASVKGSIFGAQVAEAREAGRITSVPYDPAMPVHTAWDLGVGDATAIWFYQALRTAEVRCIDYYEASGEGLPHYVSVLQRKPYVYGKHVMPPDVRVRELGTGKSRLEVAQALGLKVEVAPDIGLEDGIAAARMLLGRTWFDERNCRQGLEALTNYRRDYNTRLQEFKGTAVHDWASHGSDAFRYLAVAHQPPTERQKPQRREVFTDAGLRHTWMS